MDTLITLIDVLGSRALWFGLGFCACWLMFYLATQRPWR
jgi:hypothetical protein